METSWHSCAPWVTEELLSGMVYWVGLPNETDKKTPTAVVVMDYGADGGVIHLSTMGRCFS